MNVLIVMRQFGGFGGVESVVNTLVSTLKNEKINISIADFNNSNNSPGESLSIIHLPNSIFIDSDENIIMLSEFIRQQKVNIVVSHGDYERTHCLLNKVKTITCTKLITVWHGSPDWMLKQLESSILLSLSFDWRRIIKLLSWPIYIRIQKRKVGAFNKLVYNESDIFVLLSPAYISLFVEITGVKDISKLKVIPNPLSNEVTNWHQKETYYKKKHIIYSGRLTRTDKRVDRIITAWNAIFRSHNTWSLYIVGDGEDRERLEKLVKRLKLERIYFDGYRQNLQDYYSDASILCLTSNFEGMPMCVLEGMQHGVVPVVYDSFKASREIIENGKTGFVVPMNKKKLFINNLNYLVNNPDILKKMSQEAMLSVKKYSAENIALLWVDLFKSLEK